MSVAEYIYDNLSVTNPRRWFSDQVDMNAFFKQISCTEEQWPLKAEECRYRQAVLSSDPFGFDQVLEVAVDFMTDGQEIFCGEKWITDGGDSLEIEIESVYKRTDGPSHNFLYNLIKKHREFLENFDLKHKRDNRIFRPSSCIKLQAHSGVSNGIATRGGYVWATLGFDFVSDNELENMRFGFRGFCLKYGVDIHPSDLKLFTKPCHFAAFQCGVKVENKHLGKAFLMQQGWFGKMDMTQNGNLSEEWRYAETYHENKSKPDYGQLAFNVLNDKYKKMVRKYYHRYKNSEFQIQQPQSRSWLQSIKEKIFSFKPALR